MSGLSISDVSSVVRAGRGRARRLLAGVAGLSLLVAAAPAVTASAIAVEPVTAPAEVSAAIGDLLDKPGVESIEALVGFDRDMAVADQKAAVRDAGARIVASYETLDIHLIVGSKAAIADLSTNDRVDYIEENAEIELSGDTAIDATRVSAVNVVPKRTADGSYEGSVVGSPMRDANGNVIDGTGVGVAVIDSGANADHPDLVNRVVKNFKVTAAGMSEVRDSDTTSGHGTHVSGIVAGDGTASGQVYRGVAPGAGLYTFGTGEGLSILIANAIASYEWIIDNHDVVTPNIKVVNNSWGGAGSYNSANSVSRAVNDALAEGIVSVFAAGNDGGNGSANNTSSYGENPTPGVLMVANYNDDARGTRDNVLSTNSSRGQTTNVQSYPDLSAPGSSIMSTCGHDKSLCNAGAAVAYEPYYAFMSGTSMASPHVAGIVALLFQADPTLTPAEVEDVLEDTAYEFHGGTGSYVADPTNSDSDVSFDKGHGLVDARAALEAIGADVDGMQAASPAIAISTPATGSSQGSAVSVTGTASHGGALATTVIGSGDINDVDEPQTDIVSGKVTETATGVEWQMTVRDIDGLNNRPYYGSWTFRALVDGDQIAFGVIERAEGYLLDTDDDSFDATITPTSFEVDVDANTVKVFTTWADLGIAGQSDVVMSNIAFHTRQGPGLPHDFLPHFGPGESQISAPKFGPRVTVLSSETVNPVATVRLVSDHPDGTTHTAPATVSGSNGSYTFSGTVSLAGMSGDTKVRAFLDLDGRERAETGIRVDAGSSTDPAVPGVPNGLAASFDAPDGVTLTWSAAAENYSPITGYTVYRDGAVVGTLGATATSFSETGLTGGTTYGYAVTATNGIGEGAAATVSYTAPTAPEAVVDLAATVVDTTTAQLTWSAPASDGGDAISGYKVLRDGSLVSVLGATETSFTETGLTPGTTYGYSVIATNGVGDGASASISIDMPTTLAPDKPVITYPSTGQAMSPTHFVGGDTEADVDSVTIFIDGVEAGNAISIDGEGFWYGQVTTTVGTHTLTAIATRDGHDSAVSDPVTYVVDAAPTVEITSEGGTRIRDLRVAGTAGDDTEIVQLKLHYIHSLVPAYSQVHDACPADPDDGWADGCGTTAMTFEHTPSLATGEYRIYAQVFDSAGQEGFTFIDVLSVGNNGTQ